MQQRILAFASARTLGVVALTAASLATLSACGGDGSSGNAGGIPTATFTSASVLSPHYGQTATVTINGTVLDNTLAVTSPNCKNMTRLDASTSTTATYTCTPTGAYAGTITVKSNGTTIGGANFTVPQPQVTLTVNNTAGVNGNIVINLAGDKAPITVDNFLAYVNASPSFYTNLIFHRTSVSNHIVQGGGYTASSGGTLPANPKTPLFAPIALETTGGSNVAWSVGMARTSDPNSATSQFYINTAANTGFDGSYAVFGNLTTSSQAVAAAIAAAPCTAMTGRATGDDSCVPVPNVVITGATQTQ
jgi:cyclophilin family peptidyl-prolyl cis-trans isomerase